MKNHHIILLIFLTIFLLNQLKAQNLIEGMVTDSISSKPLSHVNIHIANSLVGTMTNAEGKFLLHIPEGHKNSVLQISHLGYEQEHVKISVFGKPLEIKLKQQAILLSEVAVGQTDKIDVNGIVKRALDNFNVLNSSEPYIQKGFFRYNERNKTDYKWLIEGAFTVFEPTYTKGSLKVGIDEIRRSYDYRAIDSLMLYRFYLYKFANNKNKRKIFKDNDLEKYKSEFSMKEALSYWNINTNSFDVTLKGQMNLLRNSNQVHAIFSDETLFETHKFSVDSLLIHNHRLIYKIKIAPNKKTVDLFTKYAYNNGFLPVGYLYIFDDDYSIKEVNYALVAGTKGQKARSGHFFDRAVVHRIVMKYKNDQGNIYLNYFSYETPKILNFRFKPVDGEYSESNLLGKNDWYYFTKLEMLFTEISTDKTTIETEQNRETWDSDFFKQAPYNRQFWESYNVLPETNEQKKLIDDLEKNISLQNQFEHNRPSNEKIFSE